MKIKLSPMRMDERLDAYINGDILTVNGIALDFRQLQDDEQLPCSAIDSPWIMSDVHRIQGDIHITLRLPHGPNAPHETRFPAAFTEPMTVISGPVPLPPYNAEEVA